MICSITNRCNLGCKGCYALGQHRESKLEIPAERFSRLFGEASEMGTGVVILAGGEPLLRKDLLESAAGHEDIIFPVFTNGILMDSDLARFFKKFDPRDLVISYRIPSKSHVTLRIYDPSGEEILELVNKRQDAGEYRVAWNGRTWQGRFAPSGIYYYRVFTGSTAFTGRIVYANGHC